jgi:hypothetical protein
MLSKPEVSMSFKFNRAPQKCNRPAVPFKAHVIPAKAGIHSGSLYRYYLAVDSRFRGNDCDLRRPCLANDARTYARKEYALSSGPV